MRLGLDLGLGDGRAFSLDVFDVCHRTGLVQILQQPTTNHPIHTYTYKNRPFFDGSTEGWRHLFSPYGPTARRPLPMTPGGVLLPPYFDRDPEYFEGGSGLGWPRRPLPRYLPFFAPPAPSGLGGWDDGWAWM